MAADLVKGEGFAVDASLIAANASHQHSVQPGEEFDWNNPEIRTRAMHEYLAALDDAALTEPAARKVSLSDPHSRRTAARQNSGGLSVQAIIGALFALPLETEFKWAIPVMFPSSIQPTDLAASGTALDRHSHCGSALPCQSYEDSHARKARHA